MPIVSHLRTGLNSIRRNGAEGGDSMNEIGHDGVFQRRVKRTQALLESNLPGIARSTGVLRRPGPRPVSQLPGRTLGAMPRKTQRVLPYGRGLRWATTPAYRDLSNNPSICFVRLATVTEARPKLLVKASLNFQKNVSFLLTGSGADMEAASGVRHTSGMVPLL